MEVECCDSYFYSNEKSSIFECVLKIHVNHIPTAWLIFFYSFFLAGRISFSINTWDTSVMVGQVLNSESAMREAIFLVI